jgi:hypothetical protein
MNIRKLFSCKCGKSSAFEISSELNLEDVTLSASCPSCLNTVHITLSSMIGNSSPAAPSSSDSASAESTISEEHGIEQAEYASVGDENVEAAVKNLFG